MSDPSILTPDFDDILNERMNRLLATLNCLQVAKIQSVNLTTQTLSAEIQVRRQLPGGVVKAYPVILDCPIIVLQGGGSYLDMPIAAGDYCLLLFNDRDIDTWWDTANVAAPNSRRKHSLSDGFALVGVNPKTSVLDLDGSVVGIRGGSAKVRLDNSAETLKTLIDDLIDAISNAVDTAGHTLNPATKAALLAIKTRFGTLLEA